MKLDDKIQYLKGVGPKMAAKLLRLGISTVEDLLYYYPRAYTDFTKIFQISSVSAGASPDGNLKSQK